MLRKNVCAPFHSIQYLEIASPFREDHFCVAMVKEDLLCSPGAQKRKNFRETLNRKIFKMYSIVSYDSTKLSHKNALNTSFCKLGMKNITCKFQLPTILIKKLQATFKITIRKNSRPQRIIL